MESLVSVPFTSPRVRKRDGQTIQEFQRGKVHAAVIAAWRECRGDQDASGMDRVVRNVCLSLPDGVLDIEQIQNVVEICLMKDGFHDVAKAYILYRQQRAEARQVRHTVDSSSVADYIFLSKYARFDETAGRRESFPEAVSRVQGMHERKYPHALEEIRWTFGKVLEKKVLPSMRTMQFGGRAVEAVNCRAFNCCATHIDRIEAFSEILYLLLCGCGVGFSVQFEHVEQLPRLAFIDRDRVVHHTIQDTIEGWADALLALMRSYVDGIYLEFDFSQIRRKGATLRTSGGKAPGHLDFKNALEKIRSVLDDSCGRQLRPIEAYDILCHAADAVLSGGIRRSAMICMFSLEDSEMVNAKTGKWHAKYRWRENSNNSVVLLRDKVTERQFRRVFDMAREWGEPGFVLSNNVDFMFNPCVEAALYPRLRITEQNFEEAQRRIGSHAQIGKVFSGFSFCNLTSINAAALTSLEDFEDAARAATYIGTLQAGYTDMPYLGGVSEMIAERDALLGVSMTGMLDNAALVCDPHVQRDVAEKIKGWNEAFATRLGIKSAARTTCIKPEGTGSLALGGVASGHHAHHARRYIRRVTAKSNEPVFAYFREMNPHMCVLKPNGDFVVEFPIQAPAGAVLKEDLSAIQFLEMVKSTQENWVIPGTRRSEETPGLTHNVSNTIHVREGEWDQVFSYLWANKSHFTAVSLIPDIADKLYQFAPCEKISTPGDEARWNQILAGYQRVDYTLMREDEDVTNLGAEAACAGGSCELSL